TRRPPLSTPFPYTTLFRSLQGRDISATLKSVRPRRVVASHEASPLPWLWLLLSLRPRRQVRGGVVRGECTAPPLAKGSSGQEQRSEEHTSELQSRENLVCR